MGHGGIQQNAVASQFHRQRHIRGGAHSGIQDHRQLAFFADDGKIIGVEDAHARTDGRAQGHHRDAAQIFQFFAGDRIVDAIGEHLKAFVHQDARGLEQFFGIGVEGVLVRDDLQLDEIRSQRFAGQFGGDHRIAHGIASGGVGEQAEIFAAQQADQVFPGGVVQVDPADGHRDHFRPARPQGLEQHVVVGVAGASQDQP